MSNEENLLEQLGVFYELWQERGQRLIGARPCGQSHDSDLPIELWGPFECHACKACV